MRVKDFVLTEKIFLKYGGTFDWWDEIDGSEEWQRFIFYLLCASYAFVSFVALVVSFIPSFYSPAFSCLVVSSGIKNGIARKQFDHMKVRKPFMDFISSQEGWFTMHAMLMLSKLELLLEYRFGNQIKIFFVFCLSLDLADRSDFTQD